MVRDNHGRFVKGNSGNPGGKKKAMFNLEDTIDQCFSEKDWITAFNAMKPRFLRGDVKIVEFIMDRRFGKPLQKQEHSGTDGNPLEVVFRYTQESENKE